MTLKVPDSVKIKKRTVNKIADEDIYFLYWQLKTTIDYKRVKVQNAMLVEETASLTKKCHWEVGEGREWEYV